MARAEALARSVEILTALQKLGEPLSPAEESCLQSHSNTSLRQFEKVSAQIGEIDLPAA